MESRDAVPVAGDVVLIIIISSGEKRG